jgi:hypothetical protein
LGIASNIIDQISNLNDASPPEQKEAAQLLQDFIDSGASSAEILEVISSWTPSVSNQTAAGSQATDGAAQAAAGSIILNSQLYGHYDSQLL